MKTYRVLGKEETGEEYCLASGLSHAQAIAERKKAGHHGFVIEQEIDYYAQAKRDYESP